MKRQIFRYILVGIGWLVALVAFPLPGAELNAFLNWRGNLDTRHFVAFIFGRPRQVIQDWTDPSMSHGAVGGGMIGTPDISGLDLMWLVLANIGLLLIALSPVLVATVRSARARVVVQCFALSLLAFPLTVIAPLSWRLPIPHEGMYLLGATHLLVFTALMMSPKPPAAHSFPIEIKE